MRQDIQVNGFTRSGTTYTYTAIKLAFPDLEVLHSHDYLDLGWRVKNNKESVACIRNPIDTIVSTLLHRNSENNNKHIIKSIIDDYIKHLKVIDLVKNDIIISIFDDIIKDFNPLLDQISGKYKHKGFSISKEQIIADMPKYKNDEDLRLGRLPRNNSDLKKNAVSSLNNIEYYDALEQANSLYIKIRNL